MIQADLRAKVRELMASGTLPSDTLYGEEDAEEIAKGSSSFIPLTFEDMP